MNDLSTMTEQTMSSLEIADLTGKQHAHVMRDIRNMFEELEIDESKFGGIYLDTYKREKPCYQLDRNLTLTLVSGYNTKMRHLIVTRWQELEAGGQPMTRLEAAKYQVKLIEELEAKEAEIRQLEEDKQDLKITLDEAEQWSSIKRQEMIHNKSFKWQGLKQWHTQKKVPMKRVFDQNYGHVNAYSAEAWEDVYGITLS